MKTLWSLMGRACERSGSGNRSGAGQKIVWAGTERWAGFEKVRGVGAERGAGGRWAGTERGAGKIGRSWAAQKVKSHNRPHIHNNSHSKDKIYYGETLLQT